MIRILNGSNDDNDSIAGLHITTTPIPLPLSPFPSPSPIHCQIFIVDAIYVNLSGCAAETICKERP